MIITNRASDWGGEPSDCVYPFCASLGMFLTSNLQIVFSQRLNILFQVKCMYGWPGCIGISWFFFLWSNHSKNFSNLVRLYQLLFWFAEGCYYLNTSQINFCPHAGFLSPMTGNSMLLPCHISQILRSCQRVGMAPLETLMRCTMRYQWKRMKCCTKSLFKGWISTKWR